MGQVLEVLPSGAKSIIHFLTGGMKIRNPTTWMTFEANFNELFWLGGNFVFKKVNTEMYVEFYGPKFEAA
jgi:hypothetical protein